MDYKTRQKLVRIRRLLLSWKVNYIKTIVFLISILLLLGFLLLAVHMVINLGLAS
ncbi:MAG: hypothetical protein KBH11_04645 [Bacteroidia bacterium]|nr:hypothetical protein [Bacteroidota bacterium]MBP9082342.1 hypothetical protein [Bacteroidia bacterium]